MDLDRRGLIQLAGAAALMPASAWLRKEPDTAAAVTTGAGAQVDQAQITLIERRINDLRRLDDDMGGSDLLSLVRADLGYVVGRLEHGRYTEAIRRHLMRSAAELARLAGWVSFDSEYQGRATRYWEGALRAAHSSGDRPLGAHILACMAMQSYNTGHPQTAIDLLETAQAGARGSATPKVQSLLSARLGRAHAAAGEKTACYRNLDIARTQLAAGPSEDDPDWSYYIDEAELALTAGTSYLTLGDYEKAADEFNAALATYGDGYARDRAFAWDSLAASHLGRGDLDQALMAGTHAVELLATQVHSPRTGQQVRSLTQQFAPYTNDRAVARFTNHAHAVLATPA